MDVDVDHYSILGLPTGEDGAKLTEKEISKAYKVKALELHPDKNRDDPKAHDKFQRVKSSYEILKDEKARKLFDDLLKVKQEQQRRHSERDAKRRRMVSDLEERERSAFAPDLAAGQRGKEESILKELKEQVARIREMHKNKGKTTASVSKTDMRGVSEETANTGGVFLDKKKILKVSWEKFGEGYTAERLRELFSKFGEVEDVVMKKKRGSALVVMASEDAAVAATGTVSGDLSNPLLVLPYQPATPAQIPTVQKPAEAERLNHLVGAGFQAFENSVLEKLRKAAEKQKNQK
ncbi:uncharacterized protein LOC133787740 [Humulus lupulus]|uniref:uncharacterized protein LOC133787740 n=1 Tax=Humulus lupulus TaxID=3486 RepID=UPI002B411ABF|nr:uncharacterized protein LOC133787740 [Humulus lupulus]